MKTVFITGGTRGIGRSIVEKFIDEGYFVVFTFSNSTKIADEMSRDNVLPFQCCNDDFEGLMRINEVLKEKNITVDIVINNAAILMDKTLGKMTDNEWFNVINTNLNSVYFITKLFLKDMLERKWGRVINMSSIIGEKGGFGQTNYSASKAGVIGFSKSLALEVAAKGITVNSVSPGYIETDMTSTIPDIIKKKIVDSIPMKKMGSSSDIAELVYFLASEKANYITGQVIGINGGLN